MSQSRHRQPITVEILQEIQVLWAKQPKEGDRTMLWAAFTTCFFGFMRSGELCAHNAHSVDATSDLLVGDVTVDSVTGPKMIRIYLKVSKTDQFRNGTDIYLLRTHCKLRPVAALLSWIVVRGSELGPLFHPENP